MASDNPAPIAQSDFEEEATRRVGNVLAAKYRLDAVIGSGGMAHVFRATNTVIGRTVAIKILRGEYARHPETVERFLREARTANIVRHPNVIDVIDFGTDSDGASFIVSEFLEGETLFQYAARRHGTIPVNELADIIMPVLSAVGEAHALGVVHRDIKPENVFLAGQRGHRTPKVLDFGISKVVGTDMTAAGMMLGTPAYMAPEVARSSKQAGPPSDVWSIGVMLFEVLTGRVPFEGETVGAMFQAITTVDAARLIDLRPDLPVALSRVVERCLKRDPNDRYSDARALAADVAAALQGPMPASGASLPPTGHESTMVGAQAELRSRLPSRTMSGIVPSEMSPSAAAAVAAIAASSRVPKHRGSGSGSGPHSLSRPSSGGRVAERGSQGGRSKSVSRRSTGGTQRSATRTSAGSRRSQVPARRLAWTDVLLVLGVGIVLAAAILVGFRLAR